MNITEGIQKVVEGQHLSRSEAEMLMDEIMNGKATDAQIASFLTALRMKCETVDELIGFAKVIRAKATPIRLMAQPARPKHAPKMRAAGNASQFRPNIFCHQGSR